MNSLLLSLVALSATGLVACTPQGDEPEGIIKSSPDRSEHFHPVAVEHLTIKQRQTFYVPAYSHIYISGQGMLPLAVTLSVRNTDLAHRILIGQIRYYDTQGRVLEDFINRTFALDAMSSVEFVIEQQDMRGGAGANFVVEWMAEDEVSAPVIETVMAGVDGTRAMAFSSVGRVIKDGGNGAVTRPESPVR
jgi:hypothetical protein